VPSCAEDPNWDHFDPEHASGQAIVQNERIQAKKINAKEAKEAERRKPLKVMLIGDRETGKTCLFSRLCGRKMSGDEPYIATRFEEDSVLWEQGKGGVPKVQVDLWDTSGAQDERDLRSMIYSGTDVILLVYDVGSELSMNHAKVEWWDQMTEAYVEDPVEGHIPDVIFVGISSPNPLKDLTLNLNLNLIVGLKSDTRKELWTIGLDVVDASEGKACARELGRPCKDWMECSSRTGEGIATLKEMILTLGAARQRGQENVSYKDKTRDRNSGAQISPKIEPTRKKVFKPPALENPPFEVPVTPSKKTYLERTTWDMMLDDADRVFHLVSELHTSEGGSLRHWEEGGSRLSKTQLVAAHGGDYHLFERIDTDEDGFLSLSEWRHFIEMMRIQKKSDLKAEKWLHALLYTLERNIDVLHSKREQREEAEQCSAILSEKDEDGARAVSHHPVVQKDKKEKRGSTFKRPEVLVTPGLKKKESLGSKALFRDSAFKEKVSSAMTTKLKSTSPSAKREPSLLSSTSPPPRDVESVNDNRAGKH